MDAGGGVVFCAYANCGRGNRLGGKWADRKYDPLTLGATSRTPNLYMGKCSRPEHTVLDGVSSFDGMCRGEEKGENGIGRVEGGNGGGVEAWRY